MNSMMRQSLLAVCLLTGLLAACDRGTEPRIEGDVIAMVNDVVITEAEFQEFLSLQRMSRPEELLQADQVLDEMINLELLRQAAVARGLDRDPEVLRQLERSKTNLMVGALLEDWTGPGYNDEQLRAEYERQLESLDRQEYKARHILLDTEADARMVIDALDAGGDFEQLAEEHSTGPSGPMGGDLGWFTAGGMVPEFSDAVRAMEPGTYTTEPVETEFGWHVILLEETRTAEAPPFDLVRDRLQQILDNRVIQDNIQDLRDQAEVRMQ